MLGYCAVSSIIRWFVYVYKFATSHTMAQVSYEDFVAAGSLGVAREKGVVTIAALL
jgi:hypothetical protein